MRRKWVIQKITEMPIIRNKFKVALHVLDPGEALLPMLTHFIKSPIRSSAPTAIMPMNMPNSKLSSSD
jgi:hypothetical protein